MTQFAYFRTPDNTIAELELPREDFTKEAIDSNSAVAKEYATWHEFNLIGIFNSQWSDSKWEHEYARLERYGYFTRERQEELFDTRIVGTLDRIDMTGLEEG